MPENDKELRVLAVGYAFKMARAQVSPVDEILKDADKIYAFLLQDIRVL